FCDGAKQGFNAMAHWCPVYPAVHAEAGTTVNVSEKLFGPYLAKVMRTKFCVRKGDHRDLVNNSFLKLNVEATGLTPLRFHELATNRSGDCVAFSLDWGFTRPIGGVRIIQSGGGRYAWLPSATACKQADATSILLEALNKEPTVSPAPQWVNQHSLPNIEKA